MNSNKKKKDLDITLPCIILVILFFLNLIGTSLSRILFYVTFFIFLAIIYKFIVQKLFNGKANFNSDSLLIYCLHFFPLALVLVVEGKFFQNKILYGIIALIVILIYSLYFWVIYFARCIKVIIDIKQDKYLFGVRAIKSILTSVLVWLSGTVVILYLSPQNNDFKVIYQLVNILINFTYPFIDMYIYVRSLLDKYMEDNSNPIKIKSHSD